MIDDVKYKNEIYKAMKKIYMKPLTEVVLSDSSEMIASSIEALADIDFLDVTGDDTEVIDIEEGYVRLDDFDFKSPL